MFGYKFVVFFSSIIFSYLADRRFQVHFCDAFSSIPKISADVLQLGILSPIIYNIYAFDRPTSPNTQTIKPSYPFTLTLPLPHKMSILISLSWRTRSPIGNLNWPIQIYSNHPQIFARSGCLTYNTVIPCALSIKYLRLTLDKSLSNPKDLTKISYYAPWKASSIIINTHISILNYSLLNLSGHMEMQTYLMYIKFKPYITWNHANYLMSLPTTPITLHSALKILPVYEEAKLYLVVTISADLQLAIHFLNL